MAARDVFQQLQSRPGSFVRAVTVRIFHVMVERFDRNNILTYASAMALQLLTAVVPLALLAFLLMGVFGQQSIWHDQIAPTVAERFSHPTYNAIDTVAEILISQTHVHWLVLASLIVLWEVSGAVRTAMGALNRIFECEEDRSLVHRFARSIAIAAAVAGLLLGALLVATRGGGWVDFGVAQVVWTIVRWLTVALLLWAVVAIVVRFAPMRHEEAGWVTLGGAIVVIAWIVASLVFGWYVTTAANYKSAFGTAIAVLTLVGYLYTSSIVFLVGAQIDRLLIEQADEGEGPLDGLV